MSDDSPLPTGVSLTAFDAVFRERPHEVLDRLRAEDPVHRDQILQRRFVTRFEDARTILCDRSLSVDPRKAPSDSYHHRLAIGDGPLESFVPTMLHLDDPEHKRTRALVSQAFTQRAIDGFRVHIQAIAEQLLDGLSGRDSFDLVADYASPLPMIVIAEMLGVDPSDMARFKLLQEAQTQICNLERTPQQSAELTSALLELYVYFVRAAEARRQRRGNDLISALVWAEESGTSLSESEIAITCNLLLVAGNLTTTDLIGNGVLALLRHPEQLAKFRAEADLVPRAIEEILRYDPPVSQSGRIALEPYTVGGTQVQAGECMTVSLLAAAHDPARHSDPHRFDIERADTSHFAFGGGAHYCLGAPLARAEAQIALRLLFERYPQLRLDPDHAIEHKAVPIFNGLTALWVRSA
jgi:cytochrome P450